MSKRGYVVVIDREGFNVWFPFKNKRDFSRAKHNKELGGRVVKRRISVEEAIEMCSENNVYGVILNNNNYFTWASFRDRDEFNRQKDYLPGTVEANGIFANEAVKICQNYNSRNKN